MTAAETLAVLWDLDGVLVDTCEWHYLAWKQVLDEEGVPFDREEFRQIFGRHNASALEVMLGAPPDAHTLVRIGERKEALFREYVRGQASPMPGVVKWLRRLKRRGALQAVASSAPLENIEFLVDEAGIRGYFDALVSSDGLPGKPEPAIFLEAARRLGTSPERCIVVEDSLFGLQAARGAGMCCIGVATTNPASALAAADRVVERLTELPEDGFEVFVRAV